MRFLLSTTAVAVAMTATSMSAQAAIATDFCLGDFTTVDANGDGTISIEEAREAATTDFDRIDSDGSGVLSKPEWHNCGLAAELGDKVGEGDIQDSAIGQTMAAKVQPLTAVGEFAAADTDQSGDVSREEAAQAAETTYDASGTELTQEEYARAYGARFSVLDTNDDNILSQGEWDARYHLFDVTFEQLDADNDNELSRSEYLAAREVEDSGEPVTVWHYFIYY